MKTGKRKNSISLFQICLVGIVLFIYSLLADQCFPSAKDIQVEKDSLAAVAEMDSILEVCRIDSIKDAEQLDSMNEIVPALQKFDNSLGFPRWSEEYLDSFLRADTFDLERYKDRFRHPKSGKFQLYPDELDVSDLVEMNWDDYYRIFQKRITYENDSKGKYYFYSIEDTSARAYDVFTILHCVNDEESDLEIIFMGKKGKIADEFLVSGFSSDMADEEDGGNVSITTSSFISKTRMISDTWYNQPMNHYDTVYDASGRIVRTDIVHYQFKFAITTEGKVIQQSMTTNDKMLPYFTEKERAFFHSPPEMKYY
ncbi:MAG: hypothetical protein HY064_04110 [Bacteroidetes bacterium]|nr:hypothetical protein [Bacteroidota bacterium]